MEAQKQAATEAMAEWLAHPSELGKRPAKLECVDSFMLHEMRYYLFRFKKSVFGGWLLGVCGGYEDGSMAHCDHVWSDMQPYDPSGAQQQAIAMVERIREHWMRQAAAYAEE